MRPTFTVLWGERSMRLRSLAEFRHRRPSCQWPGSCWSATAFIIQNRMVVNRVLWLVRCVQVRLLFLVVRYCRMVRQMEIVPVFKVHVVQFSGRTDRDWHRNSRLQPFQCCVHHWRYDRHSSKTHRLREETTWEFSFWLVITPLFL